MLTGGAKCKCKLQKWRKSCFSFARNPRSTGKSWAILVWELHGGGVWEAGARAVHLGKAFLKFASYNSRICIVQHQLCVLSKEHPDIFLWLANDDPLPSAKCRIKSPVKCDVEKSMQLVPQSWGGWMTTGAADLQKLNILYPGLLWWKIDIVNRWQTPRMNFFGLW